MKGSRRVFRQPYVYIYLYICYVYGCFVYSCGTPTFIPLGLNKAHLCLRRQASWLGLQVCLNAVNLNSFFRMFLRVMLWSTHCVPLANRSCGCFVRAPAPFVCLVCFSGCFAVFSGETQVWLGDLRVVVFWWPCVFFGCST